MGIPLEDNTAILHPWENPGSTPITVFPRTGGVSNKLLTLEQNTAIDSFSAFLVKSDLFNKKNRIVLQGIY